MVIKSGQREKFNSEPFIVTLNASDTDLYIIPARIFTRFEQIEGVYKHPVIVNNNGEKVKIKQGLLECGASITRDYAMEFRRQNADNNISIASTPVVIAKNHPLHQPK